MIVHINDKLTENEYSYLLIKLLHTIDNMLREDQLKQSAEGVRKTKQIRKDKHDKHS